MPTPFSFVRKSSNLHRHIAASFTSRRTRSSSAAGVVHAVEQRGQKMVLWTYDAYSADAEHVQAGAVLHEQPGLRHVRAHQRALTLTSAALTARRPSSTSATTSSTCSSSSALRRRSSPSTRPSPDAPRPLPSGRSACGWAGRLIHPRTKSGTSRRSCASTEPLRRHPPRHRLDGGAPPLRLRVLPCASPTRGA